ncbi:LysR family transcriptional regulator [Ferrimonas balearica]|uniref:LysR family transcriptional regulator n=1 Tax=Ferrimonas balearica TaxID=44012 RepID=UPI001C56768D|nr:LysR family transcriptional regulator [Ferrimonas balearica]MBW3138315.1 LysR family transcriptional regulator [Ferrimonas balearica]MBY6105376.1 LysR family transcriptional regulator [Ferrimonas balearica]
MRTDDLKLFMTVVDLGSFSAAAEALNLPRANVSRRIGELEKRLGSTLFSRTTRKLSLTPVGQELYQRFETLMPMLDAALDSVRSQSRHPVGKIKLGLLPEAELILHPLLQQFMERYPQISLEVTVSANGYQDLIQLGLDLCLHAGVLADSSFVARSLGRFGRGLYASPDYLARHGHPERLEQLAEHRLLGFRWPDGTQERHWQFEQATVPVEATLLSNSMTYLRRATVEGAGISHLPELQAVQHVLSGELVPLLTQYQSPQEEVWLVYRDRVALNHAARLMLDWLLAEVPKITGPH